MLVSQAMQSPLLSIAAEATLLEAARTMVAQGVDTLAVMETGQLLGILGVRDLFTAPISASYGNRMSPQRAEEDLIRIWRAQSVRNLMTDQVLLVTEETSLMQAAALMVNSGRHPLPVTRQGQIVGMIARADIVRALLAQEQG